MHRHGCCIIQQCFTTAPDRFHRTLVDAIVRDASLLLVDPFGNYVVQVLERVEDHVQFVLEHGSDKERARLIQTAFGKIVDYSCQKYSSNVIEKIIVLGDENVRYRIIEEIITSPHFPAVLHHSVGIGQACDIVCELYHPESLP